MIDDLRNRLDEISRTGPGIQPEQEAQLRAEIEEIDRAPFLLQLAYAESLYERVEELGA